MSERPEGTAMTDKTGDVVSERERLVQQARDAITGLASVACDCPYESERELAYELVRVREANARLDAALLEARHMLGLYALHANVATQERVLAKFREQVAEAKGLGRDQVAPAQDGTQPRPADGITNAEGRDRA